MKRNGILGLLTDFGHESYQIGIMKAVIKNISSDIDIIDITHDIRPFDIEEGAFVLYKAALNFPGGSTFVTVIDWGVGTSRKAIVMRTKNDMMFVAPDNGVLTVVGKHFRVVEVREITNNEFLYSPVPSHTFHGRDIFAPVGAHLVLSTPIKAVGPLMDTYEVIRYEEGHFDSNIIKGKIIYVDHFGNIQTNISSNVVKDAGLVHNEVVKVKIGSKKFKMAFVETYGNVEEGKALLDIDSSGYLEISVNKGNAANVLKIQDKEEITISK